MTLLLEVIIGLGVFAAAILLIFGLFASSQKTTASTKNLAIATDLAREVMEGQLTLGYDSVVDLPATDIPVPATIDGVQTTTTFTSRVRVFVEPANTAPNTFDFERKRVVVTISWPEVTGAPRKTDLETYVIP